MLELDDVSVTFGRRPPAVTGISVRIEDGQRLGIIGESGSGKTVTALAVMGLLDENARVTGSIRLDGEELVGRSDRRLSRLRGSRIGMVFQEPMSALDPTMRCGRQVAEVLRLHGKEPAGRARTRVVAVLGDVGFADPERVADAFPHELSGGERQRVVIAMALINKPSLVICDEPTTALDVTVQQRVLRLLDRVLADTGASCLFISHDFAVVSALCSDIAVMLQGRIVETGSRRQMLTDPRHPYTQGLVATSRIDDVPPGERLPTVADFWSGQPR